MCGRLNRLLVTANPLPLSVLSEVRVVKMDIQAALGWGWKQLVGGGAAAARGRVCVQRGTDPWAAWNNSGLRKDPAR